MLASCCQNSQWEAANVKQPRVDVNACTAVSRCSVQSREAPKVGSTSIILPFGKPPPKAMSSVKAPLGMTSLHNEMQCLSWADVDLPV